MANFINTFTAGPVGTNPANAIDTYIRADTKQALNERYSVEHYPLDSAATGATDSASANAQGRHIPGKIGVVGVGTNTQMTALSGMGNGAMFLNTTTGYFYYYTIGTGWQVLPFGYTGVIASDVEAAAGTVENKAVNPKQLKTFVNLNLINLQHLHIQDQKASGTPGGTATTGVYAVRTLNTVMNNTMLDANNVAIPDATVLSGNQITLLAGTYDVEIVCPAWVNSAHRARLQNVTDNTTLLLGTNSHSWTSVGLPIPSHILGRIILSSTSKLEVQHRVGTQSTTTDFGLACSFGDSEIYTNLRIYKLR